MFKAFLLVFIISYAQLKWVSATYCGLIDRRELPLSEVEYFSFNSSERALIINGQFLPSGI